jgi:hypothetical protein
VTHLPYIVASYILGVVIPVSFAVSAFMRMRTANRRLAAMGSRRAR